MHFFLGYCPEKWAIAQKNVQLSKPLHRTFLLRHAPLEIFSNMSPSYNMLIKKARYYSIRNVTHSGIYLALLIKQNLVLNINKASFNYDF
jgi:hypothetical protein